MNGLVVFSVINVVVLIGALAVYLWIVGGQAVLVFAEELYYRGLLMSENS